MQIDLTIDTGERRHDVSIRARAGTDLEQLRSGLTAATGLAATTPVWSAGRSLTPASLLGGDGLRTGSVLSPVPIRRAAPGVPKVRVVGGPSSGRDAALTRDRLRIGRDSRCDLVLDDDRVSRQHAELTTDGPNVRLRDLGSTNGTSIGGRALEPGGEALSPGDIARLGDSLLSLAGDDGAPAMLTRRGDTLVLNRAPRRIAHDPRCEIVEPPRPRLTPPRPVQWVTAALPAVFGVTAAILLRSPQFLLFSLLSPVMVVSGALGDRLGGRRSGRRASIRHAVELASTRGEIECCLEVETAERRRAAPDPAAVEGIATTPTGRLWERRRRDDDFLVVRVGAGPEPSVATVRTGAETRAAGVLLDVPVDVDLRGGPLGIAGPRSAATALARSVIAQLAVLHSPGDLAFAAFVHPGSSPDWEWMRWLPHLGARVACTPQDRRRVLDDLLNLLSNTDPVTGRGGRWGVILDDSGPAAPERLGLDLGDRIALTAVHLGADEHSLPGACRTVAVIADEAGSRVRLHGHGWSGTREALVDAMSAPSAERVARRMAPVIDADAAEDDQLAPSCLLTPLLGLSGDLVEGVVELWRSSAGRADTALGVAADGPLRIDLAEDGPHALIAGTTGSGKSVLLQTIVVGLAARHPPVELAFVLVDYKGGAAFADCALLPHTVGLVTDLDHQSTERALRSLDAELRRRERVLARAGASDLAALRRAGSASQLNRLVIVVDEFAALAEELPAFLRGLVSVAQRGRSLGVHLVLATQRPGGCVSPDIRANTDLRIALRMTDAAESVDVLGTADAARIGRSTPGRAWLRTGSRSTLFQGAQLTGTAPDPVEPTVELLGPWRQPLGVEPRSTERGLATLVAAISAAHRRGHGLEPSRPWLPPLPTRLPLPGLAGDTAVSETESISIGLVDAAHLQAQPLLTLGLEGGSSVLLVGSPGTGRTSALLTIALALARVRAPSSARLYLVDGSGELSDALRGLPHCAGVVGPQDCSLAARLLELLVAEAGRRTAGAAVGPPPPRLILLIDAWDAVLAGLGDTEAARCADLLTALLRSGPGAGLTVVAVGSRSLLAPRHSSSFALRLVLRLSDPRDYAAAGLSPRSVPRLMPPGRCVRDSDGSEIQLAYPGSAVTGDHVRQLVDAAARRWADDVGAGPSLQLRALPRQVQLSALPPARPRALRLGVGGDAAELVQLDLMRGARRLLVAGPPRSGRTTVLLVLAGEADRTGVDVTVAASRGSRLADLALARRWRHITPDTSADDLATRATPGSLLVVDDAHAFEATEVTERLLTWCRDQDSGLAVVLSGRADDLSAAFRGLAGEIRRSRCGVLLRPGPLDGELLGVRLPRTSAVLPPGRGVIVGEAGWGAMFADGTPVSVQVALP